VDSGNSLTANEIAVLSTLSNVLKSHVWMWVRDSVGPKPHINDEELFIKKSVSYFAIFPLFITYMYYITVFFS